VVEIHNFKVYFDDGLNLEAPEAYLSL